MLIGKGGSGLRDMQEKSGVKVGAIFCVVVPAPLSFVLHEGFR